MYKMAAGSGLGTRLGGRGRSYCIVSGVGAGGKSYCMVSGVGAGGGVTVW